MSETKASTVIPKELDTTFSINAKTIPTNVMTRFEKKSAAFLHPDDYKTGNFEKFFLFPHADGTKTYAAKQKKEYSPGNVDELTYFVDVTDEEIIGWSTLRFALQQDDAETNEYFNRKPFVDWTSTTTNHQKKGIGTRRLKIMNQVALETYGYPLHSSTNLSEDAQNVWEHLVSQGLAQKYVEEDKPRYCFVTEVPSNGIS